MRVTLQTLAACTALVTPAAAATYTDTDYLSSGTGYRSGTFDFSAIYSSAASSGYSVVLNSASFYTYGYSSYDRDYYSQYSGQYCANYSVWGYCSDYDNLYTVYDGDRTTDHLYARLGSSGSWDVTDDTYNGYTTSVSTNSSSRTTTYRYYSYGSMSGSSAASAGDLSDIEDDGQISYLVYTSGDPTYNLRVSLTVDYDLVPTAVPLPASGLLLLGAFGALGVARKKRKAA